MNRPVLDSWAVVAVLRAEPAGVRAAELIAPATAVISWINLGEVVYLRTREIGQEHAQAEARALAATITAEFPDERLVLGAARFKAAGRLSYADAFAAATAERHDAPLLTGDPELVALDGRIRVIDLRAG